MDEKIQDVKFLTALTMSCNDKDGKLLHLQFSICQDVNTGEVRAFFDVVDPSKVKLQEVKEDGLSESDNA